LQTSISDQALILSMLLLNLVGSLTLVYVGSISLIGTLALVFIAVSLVGLPVTLSLFVKQIGVKLPQQQGQLMLSKKYIGAAVLVITAVRVLGAQWNTRLAFPNDCSADNCLIDYSSVFAINFGITFLAAIACIMCLDKLQPHCSYQLVKSLLLQETIEAEFGKE
jgi:hypothetical protein